MTPYAGVAEISVGKAQGAEKEHLKKPVENDRHLAEEEGATKIWRDKNVVEHHQCQGEHRGYAQNVEGIRQRKESPFRGGQIEEIADQNAEGQKIGQQAQQRRHPVEKLLAPFE